MRLDVVKCGDFTIIDDCYNASPDSMKAALDVMSTIKGKRRIAVLGTMKELGEESHIAHKDVGEYAANIGVDELLSIGEYSLSYTEGFNNDKHFKSFNSTKEAAEYLKTSIRNEDIVLIKASRSMKFEDIVKELNPKTTN
jgi:UDP-N-acetylmuramoyl-tripeptide--D-alanyl-D-alanine ligase